MNKQVWFAHGKESGPWGSKIKALAAVAQSRGFTVESPDYSDSFDPDVRVARLLALKPRADCLVLVGSSMGGYVSAVAARQLQPAGLFLIAPAFYLPGYEQEPEPRAGLIEVVHGWDDEIVPAEHALRFARRQRCPLHMLPGGHTLVERLPVLEPLFARFLEQVVAAVANRRP